MLYFNYQNIVLYKNVDIRNTHHLLRHYNFLTEAYNYHFLELL